MKRCYYETLGCQKGASTAELKTNFRKLAMEIHPDRNPDDHTSEVKFKEISEACGGIGAEPGHKAEQCPTCSGVGKVRAQQGFFTIERTCPGCKGSGKIIKHPCKPCKGSGHVQKERTLSVDIPAGVEEGTRI